MSDSKIFMLPDSMGGSSNAVDPNLLLTSMMNNGGGFGGNGNWIWIIFLFFLYGWRGNGFGGFGNNGNGVDNALSTGYLSNQITNDTGRELLMQAINNNGSAISTLASTLNCDINSVKTAINGVQSAICQVGNQIGMSAADVKNSITTGNMSIAQQLAQCCCTLRESITLLGYQNQLLTILQTNDLVNKIDQVSSQNTLNFANSNYISAQQTCSIKETIGDLTRSILAKLDLIEDSRKDREISTLTAQLASVNAKAERAAELAPILNQLSEISCKQPNTVTVPYQPFVTVPNCYAYLSLYGNLFNNNGSIWS